MIAPTLIQPTFVTHLPKKLVPLAKLSPDEPTTVEVFECCLNGQEISPAYTEQNDPIAQRTTLEHQAGGSDLLSAPILGRSNVARLAAVESFQARHDQSRCCARDGRTPMLPRTRHAPRRAASALTGCA